MAVKYQKLPSNILRPKNTGKNKKVGDFFEIKIRDKLPFFILRTIGRVRIRGQVPKTILYYTATKKHRKK